MPQEDTKGSAGSGGALPWSSIALMLGLALGVIYGPQAPLKSWRPDGGLVVPPNGATQDINARLWQDPFEALLKHQHLSGYEDDGAALEVADAISAGENGDPIVLGVMVDVSPYAESQETRLKTRHAVLSALDVARYEPVDDQHIGHVRLPGDHIAIPGRVHRVPEIRRSEISSHRGLWVSEPRRFRSVDQRVARRCKARRCRQGRARQRDTMPRQGGGGACTKSSSLPAGSDSPAG